MISKQEVEHIAKLARLGLSEQEVKKSEKELSSILDYFDTLKEVNTSSVKPCFHPNKEFFKKGLGNVREDQANPNSAEMANKLIELAPQKQGRNIKVKAILQ